LAFEIAVLLGIVGVFGFYLYNPDAELMWKGLLTQMLPSDAPIETTQLEMMRHTIDVMARYMTGIVATGMVSSLLFGLFLGRWWQANLYNPSGFRQEYLSLTAHSALTLGTMAIVVLASISSGTVSEVSWNVAILLFVLYAFIGTAVLHTVFAAMKLARYAVPMFYITLFLIPHAILPVALIGLVDAWLNLRKKHSTPNAP